MSELLNILNKINDEKISKVIPQNISAGNTILGITGTAPVIFESIEDMNKHTDYPENTYAIVYDKNDISTEQSYENNEEDIKTAIYNGTYQLQNKEWIKIGNDSNEKSIKLFDSYDDMFNDKKAKHGDLATVIDKYYIELKDGYDAIQGFVFWDMATLSKPITSPEEHYEMEYESIYGSTPGVDYRFGMSLTMNQFDIWFYNYIGNEEPKYIKYESSDGQHYSIVKNDIGESIFFSTMMKQVNNGYFKFSDNFKQFMMVIDPYSQGIFRYNKYITDTNAFKMLPLNSIIIDDDKHAHFNGELTNDIFNVSTIKGFIEEAINLCGYTAGKGGFENDIFTGAITTKGDKLSIIVSLTSYRSGIDNNDYKQSNEIQSIYNSLENNHRIIYQYSNCEFYIFEADFRNKNVETVFSQYFGYSTSNYLDMIIDYEYDNFLLTFKYDMITKDFRVLNNMNNAFISYYNGVTIPYIVEIDGVPETLYLQNPQYELYVIFNNMISGSSDNSVKCFESSEEMYNDTNSRVGDLAIIYKYSLRPITARDGITQLKPKEYIKLDEPFTGYINCQYQSPDYNGDRFAIYTGGNTIEISIQAFSLQMVFNLRYESGDGLNYYLDSNSRNILDTYNWVLDFKKEFRLNNEWDFNPLLSYIIDVNETYFGGLYKFEEFRMSDDIFGMLPLNIIAYDYNTGEFIYYNDSVVGNYSLSKIKPIIQTGLNSVGCWEAFGYMTIIDNKLNFVLCKQPGANNCNYSIDYFFDAIEQKYKIFTYYSTEHEFVRIELDLENNNYHSQSIRFNDSGPDIFHNVIEDIEPEAMFIPFQYTSWDSSTNGPKLEITNRNFKTTIKYYDGTWGSDNIPASRVNNLPYDLFCEIGGYMPAETQLTLSESNQLKPGLIAYGKNGIITGSTDPNNDVYTGTLSPSDYSTINTKLDTILKGVDF